MRVFYPPRSRDEVVQMLRQGADTLRRTLPLREVVLFGSYAVGRHTVASDVDVLVVYRGGPRDDAFALAKRILGIPRLQPHVYSEDEAAGMQGTIQRMTRGGIRIYQESAA